MDVTKPYKFIGFGAMDVEPLEKNLSKGRVAARGPPTCVDP